MPQVVSCPSCRKQLSLPETLLGKEVKCVVCQYKFMAPDDSPKCPVCKGSVPAGAAACPDCGFHLGPPPSAKIEIDDKPNVCPNAACGTLNPPGDRLCQRCNTPLPGAIGQMVGGRYRIAKYLATGGFGVVYQAVDVRDGKTVAVKEMIATDPKEFKIRQTFFRREAEILRALQHVPIVPRVFDVIEDGTAAYLALEFIPGDNLQTVLDKPGARPFPVARVADWGAKLCDALAQMHRMNPPLIHRDLKPENVMLLPDAATIRLIDFGTAREMGRGVKERGVAKTKVYTEGYAPPEQVIGKPEPRSDLFALAGTLYHLATGKAPEGFFTGRELAKTLADYPPADRWFYELIAINLAEDLNDRYFSAIDLKADLERRALTKEWQCAKCGATTPAREPYCRGCAAPLTPPGPACIKCERGSHLGSRFCVACGARL